MEQIDDRPKKNPLGPATNRSKGIFVYMSLNNKVSNNLEPYERSKLLFMKKKFKFLVRRFVYSFLKEMEEVNSGFLPYIMAINQSQLRFWIDVLNTSKKELEEFREDYEMNILLPFSSWDSAIGFQDYSDIIVKTRRLLRSSPKIKTKFLIRNKEIVEQLKNTSGESRSRMYEIILKETFLKIPKDGSMYFIIIDGKPTNKYKKYLNTFKDSLPKDATVFLLTTHSKKITIYEGRSQ